MKKSKLLFGAVAISGAYMAARITANKHTEDEDAEKLSGIRRIWSLKERNGEQIESRRRA